MMNKTPQFSHINAKPQDLEGNNGVGRYLLLAGSDDRAQDIAKYFDEFEVRHHPQGHHLYLGTISVNDHVIDIATLATSIGSPGMEIILHELYQLGVRRFLRIGTANTLQPWVKAGNLINVQAAVRDETTTERYLPLEFPAIASLEVTSAIMLAAEQLDLLNELQTGVVHCKSSLYAREFAAGPLHAENKHYMELLKQAGVLASEMETAPLFIQTQIYNHESQMKGDAPQDQVIAGAILSITATDDESPNTAEIADETINKSIELAIETVKMLALQELNIE